mgnify:CR=1 FL=1
MRAVRYFFSIPGTFAHSPAVFREEDVVQAPITNRRDKHQSAVCFFMALRI